MNRFVSMSIFVRVVERGSFAAAAEDSGMTATMVGNHVRALERLLGTRLLNRTTRRQSLTEIGRGYYEQCVSILAQVQSAEIDARDMRARPRGRLRISAPVIFAACRLAPAMKVYLERYPDVQVELVLNDRIVDLADEGFDAAIRVGALPDSNLIARPLMPSSRIVCAAPGYLARYGTPATPKDLEQHHCLAFRFNSGAERDWSFTLADGSQQTVRVPGRLDISEGHALREAALTGLGIARLPDMMLERDLAAGKLIRLFADLQMPTFPVHIVYMPERKQTAKLASFVEFVIGQFGPERR
ncbi:LysR family transcriptional regulator [Paraburkholderia ginsengiterrae]|uniref:LysR family transcriptional regulator n=1 Tax=Paraburkholderia ginsengiterrae TaxID=1462993 RepID=A0A1A9NEQ6_9BURK|nr:LysR family transcriptional regulator [Paraburkholderia ginsengiterrae]OAJ54034.1 LysR family transcriptional regulator [Paraburkholderia ginsengiterrae]OAJ64624.1 LysR family transcriptional regulator [Paraburkholderia ginsengiterrae]